MTLFFVLMSLTLFVNSQISIYEISIYEFCYSTLDVQLKRPNGYELEGQSTRATVAVFEKPRRENLIFPVFRVRSPHDEGAGFDMV